VPGDYVHDLDFVFPHCPVLDIEECFEVFKAWWWLDRHGHLPTAGGWADQSPVWLELMDIIRSEACRH